MMRPDSTNPPATHGGDGLADVLERVLDKGLVIAGDIRVSLLDIEVLTLKVRLLIASADTAQQMGIDWWTRDPFLSTSAQREMEEGGSARGELAAVDERLRRIEELLGANGDGTREVPASASGSGTGDDDPDDHDPDDHDPQDHDSGTAGGARDR